jgi:hypothetical protein
MRIEDIEFLICQTMRLSENQIAQFTSKAHSASPLPADDVNAEFEIKVIFNCVSDTLHDREFLA